ncbi:2-phospho-L-lactate guanylyltransferase [Hwanghaeella sp. LZ110]|uniref:2-phospho-L-lactate guanylyltransferase n=1 Tax=Hwanghaeella sp. LZ110 TaxID=3402810 RepID=UPI003B66DC74
MVTALIPVKNTSQAKQRLAPVLAAAERAGLARAMLRDVLGAVTHARSIDQIFVVAENDEVAGICAEYGVSILQETANRGYNHAVAAGVKALSPFQGDLSAVILPSDIPLLTAWEVDQLVAEAQGRLVRIAPSRDGMGTNGLFLSPAHAIPSQFGLNSARRHQHVTEQSGIPCECVVLPGLAFDIDTPNDLRDFRALRSDTIAGGFLRQSHIFSSSFEFERVQP